MPKFEVAELTAQPFAYVSKTAEVSGIGDVMAKSFAELGQAFAQVGAAFAGPPLTHYTSYDGGSTSFEVGFPCMAADAQRLKTAGLTIGTTQSGTVMKATHVGPYDTVVETYNAMQDEMKARRLAGAEHMWEIYMSPPETPPEQIVTEVIWPVSPMH